MNRLRFRYMYRFTRPPWDTGVAPPELVQAFAQREVPPGPVLDLGCGTGTNTLYMARQGRQAFGIDFVPLAIRRATQSAQKAGLAAQARFIVADVTNLPKLRLPLCGYALDLGCFHGLSLDQQQRYAAGLAAQLLPGGRYMLYAADPLQRAGRPRGVTEQQVHAVFEPSFEITRTEHGAFRRGTSAWYWMGLRSSSPTAR